jgi:hypothetical protein
MALLGRVRKWFADHVQVGYLASSEVGLAWAGCDWDGLRLGRRYRVCVVEVPREGELTANGRPKLPICRVQGSDGHFVGRYIVTEVDNQVRIGDELIVLITGAQARVVFATAQKLGSAGPLSM